MFKFTNFSSYSGLVFIPEFFLYYCGPKACALLMQDEDLEVYHTNRVFRIFSSERKKNLILIPQQNYKHIKYVTYIFHNTKYFQI